MRKAANEAVKNRMPAASPPTPSSSGPADSRVVVNGATVHTTPKTGLTAKTDGLYGIRVNHQLEVHIDGFGMTKG